MIVLTDEQNASLTKFAESASKERGLEALHINVRGTRSRPIIEIVLYGIKDVLLVGVQFMFFQIIIKM